MEIKFSCKVKGINVEVAAHSEEERKLAINWLKFAISDVYGKITPDYEEKLEKTENNEVCEPAVVQVDVQAPRVISDNMNQLHEYTNAVNNGLQASQKQIAYLKKLGYDGTTNITAQQASQLIGEYKAYNQQNGINY